MSLTHVISKFLSRLRIFTNKMVQEENLKTSPLLLPPENVRGMTKWRPELFKKSVKLPHVDLPAKFISKNKAGNLLKKYRIKIPNFHSIQEIDNGKKRVIFDPEEFEKFSKEVKDNIVENFDGIFGEQEHSLDHSNFRTTDVFKCVLPETDEGIIL